MLEFEVSRERDGERFKPGKLVEAARPVRDRRSAVIPHLWEHRDQEITSVVTSVNSKMLPALFKKVLWQPGTVNADLGAGRYHSNVTTYLQSMGVMNWPFDPFSLTREASLESIRNIAGGRCDTVTITNCVNVIQNPLDRDILLLRAFDALKPGGKIMCQFHEGDRSGIGRVSQRSKDGSPLAWQENRRTKDYLRDIESIFKGASTKGNIIIALKG